MSTALQAGVKNPYLSRARRTLSLIIIRCSLIFLSVGYGQNQSQVVTPASADSLLQAAAALKQGVIVFNSNRTGNDEIYVMSADGSGVRELTNDDRYDSWWPRISPDRTQILFYRSPKGVHDNDYTKQGLWVMGADGSSPRQVRAAGADGWNIQLHAEWSPDGKNLVMVGGQSFEKAHIYITDQMGRNPRPLTSDKSSSSNHVDPSWSPDGKTIVFTACPTKKCSWNKLEVFIVPATGSQPPKRLTFDSVGDYDPYYSPDGRMIGWTSMVNNTGTHGIWNIRLAFADGSEVRFVTNDNNVNGYPAWSKDGKLMYFHRVVYGGSPNFGIYAIRPDGAGMKVIAGGEEGNDEYPST